MSNFGNHDIPKHYGVCPRCKGQLFADVFECVTATGTPTEHGFMVYCLESQIRIDEVTEKAMETENYNLMRTVESCMWDYESSLTAQKRAYKYLRKLKDETL